MLQQCGFPELHCMMSLSEVLVDLNDSDDDCSLWLLGNSAQTELTVLTRAPHINPKGHAVVV